MVELTITVAVLGALGLGFFFRILWDKVKQLEGEIETRVKPKEEEPESTFLDPDDVVQRARFEQEEIRRQLNPDE